MSGTMSEKKQLHRVSEVFDAWAESGRAEGMEEGHAFAAREAFRRLELEPGQRYLDIGCGNGYSVRWAAEQAESVEAYGLDVSAKMIARARRQSEHLPNARFIHAPFPIRELKARSFDAMLSMEVFYYLENLEWGLLSAARLLKPGGRFACVVDYYEENVASHDWPQDLSVKMTLLSADGWQAAMTDVGFEVLDQTRIKAPLAADEEPSWKHTEGSLLTVVSAPWHETPESAQA
jgi:ubiquinone/menaquinone biosynthesis C-methylase UbiE